MYCIGICRSFGVADKERRPDLLHDLLHDPVETDRIGEPDIGIEVVVSPDPQHVLPVVKYGPLEVGVVARKVHGYGV